MTEKLIALLLVFSIILPVFAATTSRASATTPTVTSCDANGFRQTTFFSNEDVYVYGNGFLPSANLAFYVINHQTNWTDGETVPTRIAGTATAVSTDTSGKIQPTRVWAAPLTPGKYDILIDVDGNGAYDSSVDPVTTIRIIFAPTALVPVPHHWALTSCGPTALEEVLDYYGEDISQYEIANAARDTVSVYGPGVVPGDARRAAQFSNLSISVGSSSPYSTAAGEPAITGYTLRGLGYAAFEAENVGLETLKRFIDQGKPLILPTWGDTSHSAGEWHVAVGYDENNIYFADTAGIDYPISITEFLDLWSMYHIPLVNEVHTTFNEYALYVTPWLVNWSAPSVVEPNAPFQVTATITYPQPLPNALDSYPASQCKATIALPFGLSLANGESQTKTWGSLQAGESYNLSWTVVTNSSISSIGITAEGIISGSVDTICVHWGDVNQCLYNGYSYSDRIGVSGNFPINIKVPHEITVQDVAFKNVVGQGYGTNVSISLLNDGQDAEKFNITVYCSTLIQNGGVNTSTNQMLAGTVENITLSSSTSSDLTFTWNTTGFAYGNYVISVRTSTVLGAVCTFNSSHENPLKVTIPGDIDGNFKANLADLVILAQAYGSKPGDPNWNSNADIDGNGVVGLSDLFALAKNYGQHYP